MISEIWHAHISVCLQSMVCQGHSLKMAANRLLNSVSSSSVRSHMILGVCYLIYEKTCILHVCMETLVCLWEHQLGQTICVRLQGAATHSHLREIRLNHSCRIAQSAFSSVLEMKLVQRTLGPGWHTDKHTTKLQMWIDWSENAQTLYCEILQEKKKTWNQSDIQYIGNNCE